MIEFFLKNTFPSHYGVDPNDVSVPIVRKTSPFNECDQKACDDAANTRYNKINTFNKFDRVCSVCDHIILSINNNNKEIAVVEFEKYIDQFPAQIKNSRSRCDLLMTDCVSHEKIVYCDLCCYDERYIGPNHGNYCPEGKRAKARKQMEESIELFMDIDVLNHFVLTCPEKICLFAYREYSSLENPIQAQRGNAESNMQAMITTASTTSGQVISKSVIMKYNFTFVQNRYPSVYNW